MKSFAVALTKLNISQDKLTLLKTMNRIVQEGNIDCSIFHTEYNMPPLYVPTAMFQICEMWDYTGTVITTELKLAKKLINCPGPQKKIFYIWNLEWMKDYSLVYNDIAKVYCNPKLDLIARSEAHANTITKCFKEPIAIFDNWELRDLEKVIV